MYKEPVLLRLNGVPHWVGKDALSSAERLFENYDRIFVLTDENTERDCLPVFRKALPGLTVDGILRMKSGEQNKNIRTAIDLWHGLTDLQADRNALLINLGGGVITDIGGFVAATFKRGIDFVNVPTTLLGQVDAAIGSKTGVDFENYKNHVGLFADPVAVIVDPVFLKTLPEIFMRSGFAEMVKYALIMDLPLWERVAETPFADLQATLSEMIVMSVKDKIAIVEKDKHESGLRKLLNFGHTVGHALETFFMNTPHPVTHGQAVAAGMICATWLSERYSASCTGAAQVYRMLDENFDRLSFEVSDIPDLINLMRQDKKNIGGEFRFTLLETIGRAKPDIPVSEKEAAESLRFYLTNQ
jgi:3-dehydroquinate synthase